jgi:hypothetical protein
MTDNQGLNLKTTRKQEVEEVPYGMYVWELPTGEILGDDEGNVMNCFVWEKKDRPKAVAAIKQAAKSYGFPEGKAVWWSGRRPIDDEELERQLERAKEGFTPDPLDIAGIRAEAQELKLYE